MRTRWKVALTALLLAVPATAFAGETISYTYDTLGRLVKVVHTGSVNNNLTVTYSYDAADNRVTVNVSGAH